MATINNVTAQGWVKMCDDFLESAITNRWNSLTENSGTAATGAGEDGILNLVTGAASGNRSGVTQTLSWRPTGGPLIMEVVLKNVTAVTNRCVFVGFTDVATLETPIEMPSGTLTSNATDAIGFLYDTDATNDRWHIAGVKGDADSTLIELDEIYDPVADEYQGLKLAIYPDGHAVYSVNGQEIGRTEAGYVAANVSLTPAIYVETRTTAAQTVHVDMVDLIKGRKGNT